MQSSTAEAIADSVREAAPALFAGIVTLAGMWMTYDLILRGQLDAAAGIAIIAGAIGAAVAFIFQRGAIAQTAQAVTNGAATAAVARAAERAGFDQGPSAQ